MGPANVFGSFWRMGLAVYPVALRIFLTVLMTVRLGCGAPKAAV
jgi:hypothetical protein